MIWIGIIVGFATGVVFITLCYTPLVDKVKLLEAKLNRDRDLVNEAIKAMRQFERENECLKADLKVLRGMVTPEIYAKFFDAPFNN